jgi:hypothetical protein
MNSKPQNTLPEVTKMTNFDNVAYFTSFHECQDVLFDPQFNLQSSFTEKMIEHGWIKQAMKVVFSAGGGFVLGAAMAMMMSSFEFNSTLGIDTDRSGRS